MAGRCGAVVHSGASGVWGVVAQKKVVLLEFKGLPTLVLLINPLVKGKRDK